MSSCSVHRPSSEVTECALWVELLVDSLDPEGWCPLGEFDPPVRVVDQQVQNQTCVVHVDVSGDADLMDVVQMRASCGQRCARNVLFDAGHVACILEVRHDGVVIGARLPDQAAVGDLVEELKTVSDRVSLRRLSRESGECDGEPVTVDLSALTEKQREAATLAVAKGYYRTPRTTTMDELAAELGISKSALSQRLSAVEAKLATAVFQ